MAFESFDPRVAYRENLGVQWDVESNGNLAWCITITDSKGDPTYIPIYLSEEIKTEQLPGFPYIEMSIPPGNTTYVPGDVTAAMREKRSLVILHVYFTDTDNIDRTAFAKKIKDKLHDLTRINQSITSGIDFMNIEDDGLEEETDGHQVVFHYVATLYMQYYDLCS